MNAELVIIGNEIIRGLTVDTNSAYLGRELETLGIAVSRKTAVGDDPRAIRDAVSGALRRVGLAICTGGLGPTGDDVTKKAVAGLFRSPLVLDCEVLKYVVSRFTQRGIPMPAANREQAMVPDQAAVLHNPQGTAPGLLFFRGEKLVALLPGVPNEVRAIWQESLKHRLAGLSKGTVVECLTLRVFGLSESALAEKLALVEVQLAPGDLAYLPGTHGVDLRLTFTGTNRRALASKMRATAALIGRSLGDSVYGRNDETLASVCGALLREKGLTIALAESCTGGLASDRLTDVLGCSEYFAGSVVTYSNALKTSLLGVSAKTLKAHGAVSPATAREMALGARKRLGCDIGLAITGIAGPGGWSADKPVGLVYFAIVGPKGIMDEQRRFGGTRRINKELAANTALNLLRLYLLNLSERGSQRLVQ